MDPKFPEELRQKHIKTPPEDMTAKPVKNMADSDLLDMHYFLTEDDDLDKKVKKCSCKFIFFTSRDYFMYL